MLDSLKKDNHLMWNFKDSGKIEKNFIDYHMSAINEPEFTHAQLYQHTPRVPQNNEHYPVINLEYEINQSNALEYALLHRKSTIRPFEHKRTIATPLIGKFAQLAFIGGHKENRTYPSGGAQYYVNIYFLFNQNFVAPELVVEGTIMKLNCDTHKLLVIGKQPWSRITEVFIQRYLAASAQFAIILSCDIHNISKKYIDISYKLVQQEAGHLGQNIQLVAGHLGLESTPLGGFYDIELSELLGDSQTSLYAFLLG